MSKLFFGSGIVLHGKHLHQKHDTFSKLFLNNYDNGATSELHLCVWRVRRTSYSYCNEDVSNCIKGAYPKLPMTISKYLIASHRDIQWLVKKQTFESFMRGFGPFHHMFKKGNDQVFLYSHQQSEIFWKALMEFQSSKFWWIGSLMKLVDIMIAMYLWRCPRLLTSFFMFSTLISMVINVISHLWKRQWDWKNQVLIKSTFQKTIVLKFT